MIDGISVYETRLRMGESLAEKIERDYRHLDIDVVMPIPDSSRPSAMELANRLGLPYREGFIKNRYIGRTFIMPGQAIRRKSVRQKLNAIALEFKGKNVLLVDDSIVRGTTSREIVQMARESGARKVFFASASPPGALSQRVRHRHADRARADRERPHARRDRAAIGCDALIYQDLDALVRDVRAGNERITQFETSCFSGHYVTGDVTAEYLAGVEASRNDGALRAQAEPARSST